MHIGESHLCNHFALLGEKQHLCAELARVSRKTELRDRADADVQP
jgi:hypothetical protein